MIYKIISIKNILLFLYYFKIMRFDEKINEQNI